MSEPVHREVAVLNAALERSGAERAAYLDQACAGDAALRQQVEALLGAHEEAEDFLEDPHAGFDLQHTVRLEMPFTEKPGDKIGRYKLLQQIGEGGCGIVYMAEQEEPVRRRVALKIIKLGMDTKSVIARFEAERQALALMDHPNIAKVLDAGATETGRPYFVMELVRGVKITEFCDENKLSTEGRLRLFIQVCQAIQHAHQKGVIHRDIKPSNILVTINDGEPVPKVIDFGIAKATAGPLTDKTVFTAFEQFIGTPAYMSPEQAVLTSLDIDTRSDIYSLGVLLYELLTGKTPFDAKELLKAGLDEMRRTIREQEPPKPSTQLSLLAAEELTTTAQRRHTEAPKLLHVVRGDLDWIVMKCLEKERARRYDTANGVAADILRHLNCEPVIARPPSKLYEFQKTVRRHKFGFMAATMLVLVLTLGVVASTWQAIRATRAERDQIWLRRVAEAKERKSEQVAQFLEDMLQGVEPSVALGRDTTMLREILKQIAARVSTDLTNEPEVRAELQSTMGEVYRALGEFSEANRMQEEALATRRKLFGDQHLTVARSLYNLANVLRYQGRLAEAEAMFREALLTQTKLLGRTNSEVAQSLDHLASSLAMQGRLTEAEPMFREALAIRQELWGDEHREVAKSLDHLAYLLFDQGKLAAAETTERDALEIRRKLLGPEHPELAVSCYNLALILDKRGKLVEAEEMQRQAYTMYEKLLANTHPTLIASRKSLIDLLNRQGKKAEAEALMAAQPSSAR